MTETIIAALISAGAAILVCVLTQWAAAKKTEALVVYRLEQLEQKVDKHNNLVEKTYKLEGEMKEVQHDICDLKARKE